MESRYTRLLRAILLNGGTMSGVEIRVRANTTQARGELQKLEKSVGRIESVTRGLATSIKSAVAAYSGFISVKGIVAASDSLTNLENRIALVTGRGKESQATLQRLFNIAARGRVSVQTTAETFNRFGLALSEAGKGTEEILAVTEAVAKAATLSGASAESAQAAIIQLGQGLASGELRGEELNSVLEQTPRIAQAIADGLGVPFGDLRKLAKEGQITSEGVFNAIISQIQAIDEEFLTLEPTVGSLTTIMRDEFTRALSALDDIGGFSESARGKIILLTEAFRFIADRAEINFLKLNILLINFRMDVQKSFRDLKSVIASLFTGDFDFSTFKQNFQNALGPVKEFFGIGEQTQADSSLEKAIKRVNDLVAGLDLSGYLPSLDTIIANLANFANNVMGIFLGIYNAVVGNSTWGELFWEGANAIGGPKFQAAIAGVLSTLRGWGSKIKNIFVDILYGARGFNEFGEAARGERSGGLVSYFTKSIEPLTKLKDTISGLGETAPVQSLVSVFKTLSNAISNASESVANYVKNRGGLDDIFLGQDLRAFGGTGPKVTQKDGEVRLKGEGSDRGPNIAEQAITTAFENKYLILGGLLAAGFAYKFPDLTKSAFEGVFFVVGAAIAAGSLAALRNPVVLTGFAIVFGPNVLEKLAESGAVRELGSAIASGIVKAFESDAEGRGIGQRIFDALVVSLKEFGGGLLEGFDIIDENSESSIGKDITELFVGAITGALTAALGFSVLTKGISKTAMTIIGLIAKGFKGAAAISILGGSLAEAIQGIDTDLAENDALDDKDKKKDKNKPKANSRMAALSKGKFLGRALLNGLGVVFSAVTVGNMISNAIEKAIVEDPEEGPTKNQQKMLAAFEGAVAGGALGALFGPAGAIGGAIIGAAVGGSGLAATLSDVWDKVSISGALDWSKEAGLNLFNKLVEAGNNAWTDIEAIFSKDINLSINAQGFKEFLGVPLRFLGKYDSAGNPIEQRASGGYITGEGGPTDDKIPAMLSNGEFVIKASSVKKFGTGFMSMINAGIMPKLFSEGGPPDPRYVTLQNDKSFFEKEIARQNANFLAYQAAGKDVDLKLASRALNKARKGLARVEVDLAQFNSDGHLIEGYVLPDNTGSLSKGGGTGGDNADKKYGEDLADSFQQDFRNSFFNALRTGDFDRIGMDLADSLSMKILDSFATGFTNAIFDNLGLGGKDGVLTGLFSGMEEFGQTLGGGVKESVEEGITESEAGDGSLLKDLSKFFKGMFNDVAELTKALFKGISDLFSGSSTGGGFGGFGSLFSGGFGSLFSSFGSLIGNSFLGNSMFSFPVGNIMVGLNKGGIVPHTPYSKAGMDSVPAMLTPGELVVPESEVSKFTQMQKQKEQQVFNINVSGDVSRQTRKEIIKMIPEITTGVNMENKENNFGYRGR